MIGIHLMIDGQTEKEVSTEVINHILTDLPPKIDMHILDGPHIIKGVKENPGFTGIEVIDKSHISRAIYQSIHLPRITPSASISLAASRLTRKK